MALDDLKPLIEEGNKTIAALRSEFDEKKKADVVLAEKQARMEADLAAALKAKQDLEAREKALSERLEAIEAKMGRPGGVAPKGGSSEYKAAFMEYLRNPRGPGNEAKLYELQSKATDVRTSTGASGGFALPEEIATQIAKTLVDISPIRSIARVVQVGTSDYKELVDRNGFATEWLGETSTRNQTNTPDLAECAPTFGELAAKPEATRHSLEDLFFNVEDWLIRSGTEAFAVAEGTAFVSGDGTNKPTGILAGTPVSTADSGRTYGVLQYVATGQAAALATNPFDTFNTAIYALKAGYRTNARWLTSSINAASLANVKDSTGRYLLQTSVAAGVPDTIGGYPVVLAEDMPTIAANAHAFAFGDFSRGYLIADRVGMGMLRDEITKPGWVRLIMFKRVGGKVLDSNAIKLIKIAAS